MCCTKEKGSYSEYIQKWRKVSRNGNGEQNNRQWSTNDISELFLIQVDRFVDVIILIFIHYIMNKVLVEFLGTLFFLYVIIATGNALAIGAALTIAIMLGGKISGGNFNPAVTIMMIAAGKQPMSDAIPYILAQVAGGLAALELYKRFKL
jgi:glycerol uptake facilitator-like aquaporin